MSYNLYLNTSINWFHVYFIADDSSVFLTPPSSGSVTMETQTNNQQQQTQHYLQNHAKFLQSVIHLRTICKHSKVKSTRSKNRGFLTMAQQCQIQRSASDAKIVNETLTRCLQTIYSNVDGNYTSRYMTSLRECSALIVQLLDQDDVKYLIQNEVIRLIELIVHKVCSVDHNAKVSSTCCYFKFILFNMLRYELLG